MATTDKPLIGIIMGSQSDYATMRHAEAVCKDFQVSFETRIVSAHRTPDRLKEYASTAQERGIKVIIAGAGGAAHLPGMTASETILPVHGVPIQSKALNGQDSLLSIVQMPAGIPVSTFAIGEAGARNAALQAIAVLALSDNVLAARLMQFRQKQTAGVAEFPIAANDVGSLIASGKTKNIYACTSDPYSGYAQSKDMVTWSDQYQLYMPGKGVWSNEVTCKIFELLSKTSIPTAYRKRVDDRTFETELCDMYPFEVVVCGIVDGKSSFLKRNPVFKPEEELRTPIVQFHLKTSGRTYLGRALPCDDPLMLVEGEAVNIYLPSKPVREQQPIFSVPKEQARIEFPGFEYWEMLESMSAIAYNQIRHALMGFGGRLYDIKFEYGCTRRPNVAYEILLADVVDPDSWRLTINGERADKQPIRNLGKDGADEQRAAYLRAVEIVSHL